MASTIDILLVEDNSTDAELALRSIRREGLDPAVEVVGDGARALDFLVGRGKDRGEARDRGPRGETKLVLLDLRLPRVDGMEVLRQIKSNPETRQIPVVVLTSSRQESDVRRCYELGANSYVAKPVDFEAFAETVHEVARYWMTRNEPPQGGGEEVP